MRLKKIKESNMDRLARFRRYIRDGGSLPLQDMQAFLDAMDRRYEDLEYHEDRLKQGDALMEEDIAEAAIMQTIGLLTELLCLHHVNPRMVLELMIKVWDYEPVRRDLEHWKKDYDRALNETTDTDPF
jgi:hypothetical protein